MNLIPREEREMAIAAFFKALTELVKKLTKKIDEWEKK